MTSPPSIEILPGNSPAVSPLISICIPNFNGAEYIGQCIRSVLAQECDCEIEIILHDDASTDNSLDIIREQFPEVHVLASKTNAGFCISNNRMVAHSHGRFILLLNNDAVLRAGSLKAFVNHTTRQPKQGILGLPQYTLINGTLVDRGYHFDPFMNPIPVFAEGPTEVGAVTGACLWIPRDLWETIGGFPPWFESVAEDIFLCCAARLIGHSVTLLEGPGFDHWIGRNLGGGKVVQQKLSSSVRRRSLTERNKTWVMMMCYPLWLLMITLPFHFLFLGIEALAILLWQNDWQAVKTIYAKLPGRVLEFNTEVCKLRSKLQSQRKISFDTFFATTRIVPWKLIMFMRFGFPKISK